MSAEDAPLHLPPESQGTAPGRARLIGKRILIVGGGQDTRGQKDPPIGNGRAISVLFAREGASVAVADRDAKAAQATCAAIAAEQGKAVALIADVAKPDDVARMIEETIVGLGGLDGAVFNVGIAAGMGLSATTPEEWDLSFRVNTRGAMLTAKAALPRLPIGGAILFVSSIASLKPGSRIPAYDASKAALEGLMRHVGLEGAKRRVRANLIALGLMDTSIGRAATEGRPGRAKTPVPLGRQGTGWESAYAALFLMSDEAAYVGGQVLVVDGGLTALR